MGPLALWKRFWLLFTAIWVAVSLLHALTLVTLADEVPGDRLAILLLATVLVPGALYGIGWIWERIRDARRRVMRAERR
ncbi:MAG: hypothetical protein ACT4P9_05205 [Betaproteobacteria bacterium]